MLDKSSAISRFHNSSEVSRRVAGFKAFLFASKGLLLLSMAPKVSREVSKRYFELTTTIQLSRISEAPWRNFSLHLTLSLETRLFNISEFIVEHFSLRPKRQLIVHVPRPPFQTRLKTQSVFIIPKSPTRKFLMFIKTNFPVV